MIVSLVLSVSPSHAQYIWTGLSSSDWFDSGNWLANVLPGNPLLTSGIAIGIKSPFLAPSHVFNHFPVYDFDNTPYQVPGPLDMGHSADTTFTMQNGIYLHDFSVGLGMGPFHTKWIQNGGTFSNVQNVNHWVFGGFAAGATAEIEMNGGLMHIGQLYMSWNGGTSNLLVNGGEIRANEAIWIAANNTTGTATLVMNGGLLKTPGTVQFGGPGTSQAIVTITGGSIETSILNLVRGSTLFSGGEIFANIANITTTNFIDFQGGVLYLTGDQTGLVDSWISQSLALTSLPNHFVTREFNGTQTKVYARVIPEPCSMVLLLVAVLLTPVLRGRVK